MDSQRSVKSLDEWELSKENVLPLKQGRKMTNLTAALQPQNIDRQQQLNLQRQGFETELRAYSGDDPLDPWIRYIQWTEQNFPQGGRDSHLSTLIQKCLIQFKTDEQYKQDLRFVSIWLKMAQYDNESLEIFKFMQANQIGTKLTMFYEAWAWELEQAGNTKRADSVYKEGLAACNAQSRDKLEKAMIEFQSRVGRATMQQLQEGAINPTPSEEQRATLGDLRARGKHQKVGTNRTGSARLSGRGGLQVASVPLQQVGNQISIFCDDGASSVPEAGRPEAASEWKHLPNRSEAQKENTRSAAQWAGQRLPQRNVPKMTFQEVGAYSRPDFAVHVDDNAQEMTTPRKPIEMGCQVLSEKKISKPANSLQCIKQDNTLDNTQVMYCKHLIYGGAREMSFEELRAIKHKEKKEEKKLRVRMMSIEELLKKQTEQNEMLQQQLARQELKSQQLINILAQKTQADAAVNQQQGAMQPAPFPASDSTPACTPAPVPAAAPAPTHAQMLQARPPIPSHQPAPSDPLSHPLSQPAVPAQSSFHPSHIPSSQLPVQLPVTMAMPASSAASYPQAVDEGSKMVVGDGPVSSVSHNSILDGNVTKSTLGLHSGDTMTGCTKHLVFDDITGATGNFEIFCDEPKKQNQASSNLPTGNAVLQSVPIQRSNQGHKPTSTTSLPAECSQTEQSFITPNQSLNMNTSMANPNIAGGSAGTTGEDKTPQTSCLSDKTPTSSSTSYHNSSTRMGRLSNIRTPKGLTAPSPTINTKEALGVINAMLNSSLETSIYPWDEALPNQVAAKEFEMEFSTANENEKQPVKGLVFEEQSAFTRIGGLGGGQGIVPRRQPLAIRPGILSQRPQEMVSQPPPQPTPVSASTSSIAIFQDDVQPIPKAVEEDKIKIFEENDNPIDDTKENTQSREQREMTGVLQESKGIPFMPLEDEAAEEEKGMEVDEGQTAVDPLASSQHRDPSSTMNITLPPASATANYSFDVAARMASTPFNQAAHQQLSFIPPMSTIKPKLQGEDRSSDVGLLSHQLPQQEAPATSAGLAARVTQPVNESFEKTEYMVGNHSGGLLSPIMETSAENVRSSASSSASTTNSHASASSLDGSHARVSSHASTVPASAALAPAPVFGFNIYTENDPSACPPSKTLIERNTAVPTSSAAGFSIHMDDNDQYSWQDKSAAAVAKPAQEFSIHVDGDGIAPQAMDAMSQSVHNLSLSARQSKMESRQLQREPCEAETSIFLQKEDLPALEMSFIPDRTLQDDVTAVEQELTTFGIGSTPLDYSDPFNAGLHTILLSQLSKPLEMHKSFYQHNKDMPSVRPGLAVNFGDEISVYNVIEKIGEGAFATVYLASSLDAQDITDFDMDPCHVVLKVQQPPCPWEFYILRELHARLSRLPSQVDVRPSVMSADCAHVFSDRSCLVTEYCSGGTLLDLINLTKKVKGDNMPEEWVLHLTVEMLQVVELMHRCNIIHGDIKPDNFLVVNRDSASDATTSSSSNLLKLIDMGRSIDVSLFPADTVFTAKCNTSGFNCVEMQTNRPWKYQVDYYGIAGTIHCMMFGKYMKVFQEGGVWKMTSKIRRTAKAPWKRVFHTLLNVASCDPADQPSLADLRRDLQGYITRCKEEIMMDLEILKM